MGPLHRACTRFCLWKHGHGYVNNKSFSLRKRVDNKFSYYIELLYRLSVLLSSHVKFCCDVVVHHCTVCRSYCIV